MSIISRTFEVKVKVGQLFKTYHYEANTNRQAAGKAKRHGRIISIRKVDIQALLGKIENIKLDEEPERYYLGGGIYEDELNIDQIIGLKGSKTASLSKKRFKGKYLGMKRRSNREKERERQED